MRFPLELPPGLVSDDTAFASTGRWADGENVRFEDGRPEVLGGWSEAYETALTGVCRNILAWTDQSAQSNIAFGTHSKLMVLKGGALADITPAGLAAGNVSRNDLGYGQGGYGQGGFGGGALSEFFPRTWSLANWGQNLMASPRNRTLYIWENSMGVEATEVTEAPDHISSMLVNSKRQVMAFGCEDVDGTFNPMCIRGSDFASELSDGYTEWTPSTSNNSFQYILPGGGRIVKALELGTYIIVWTDTSVFQGYFQNDPIAPWRFDLVADNCGLAGPNALVAVNQVAFWLTPDLQFYRFQVGAPPVPLPCPIGKDFRDNLDTYEIDKVVCSSVSKFDEIWWDYPDTRDTAEGEAGENSRCLIMKAANPAIWSKGVRDRTAAIDSGPLLYPLAVDVAGTVLYHEYGNDANGEPLEWFIRSSDLYIDDAEAEVNVDGIQPDFKAQQGAVYLKVYTKKYPQADAKVKGPYALLPGREKRDFFFNARIASFEFSGSAAPSFVRVGKPTFGIAA